MASFKNYISSLRYHTITRPSITLAKHAIERGYKKYKLLKSGRKPGVREAVLKKTRGNLASNKRYFSKTTVVGQKRRAEAAAKAKYIKRPLRTHNRPAPPAPPSKAAIARVRGTNRGTTESAVATSKNYGHLRTKLTGQVIRNMTRKMASQGASRKEIADTIRVHRQYNKQNLKNRIKAAKKVKFEEAARIISNRP